MNLAEAYGKMQADKIGKIELVLHDSVQAEAIVWQPGDGYRYTLLFQRLPKPMMELIGASEEHVLVTYYNGNKNVSWPMFDGGTHMLGYVADRFEVKNDTASFLTALINMTVGNYDYGMGIYVATQERRSKR